MRHLRGICSTGRRCWLRGWLLAALLVLGMGAQAQTTAQPPSVGPADAPDPAVTFRAGVTLVRTDVIVRDKDGLFLSDLTPADFIIEEDGVAQEVASLVLVHGGRVYNQLTPPSPVQTGIILPTARIRDDTAGRIILFFVDALHLQADSTPKARHFIKEVADVLVHEGDLVGFISNGTKSAAVDLTYDRGTIDAAVDNVIGSGYGPRELITEMQEGSRGPEELRWRAHRAFWTVSQLLKNLETIEDRRKVLVYVSTGYDLNPFELQRAQRDNREDRFLRDRGADLADGVVDYPTELIDPIEEIERQGVVFADGDLMTEITELTQAANRANTTFYTMDPRGLISAPDVDYNVPIDAWREYMSTTRSSLRSLAEQTGGISIVNTNNLESLLRQIDAETSDYYILGFNTTNEDATHRTRELNVSVKRDGVTVQSRASYTFSRAAIQAP